MADTSKRCARCGAIKPPHEFHRHSGYRDGRRSVCKDCRKVAKAERSDEVTKASRNDVG